MSGVVPLLDALSRLVVTLIQQSKTCMKPDFSANDLARLVGGIKNLIERLTSLDHPSPKVTQGV